MAGAAGDATDGTGLDQMPRQLVGAAQESVREQNQPEALSSRLSPQDRGLLNRQHKGLFRIDMLARIERLGRHRVMDRGHREVDDHVDVVGCEQILNAFGPDAVFGRAGAGCLGIDVRAGANLDTPEHRRKVR
jgi:hypothetical protein